MNLILDTHVLIWYINNTAELSTKLKQTIQNADSVFVSAITCYEVIWLVNHGRINLPNHMTYHDWISIVKQRANIQILPIDDSICEKAVLLPEHHKDPMDRLIIATALIYDMQLASFDEKFVLYDELKDKLINK